MLLALRSLWEYLAASSSGATLTANASAIAGAVTTGASAPGQTLSDNVTIIAGAAHAGASPSGQTLSDNVAIIAGAVTTGQSLPGKTLTAGTDIVEGRFVVPVPSIEGQGGGAGGVGRRRQYSRGRILPAVSPAEQRERFYVAFIFEGEIAGGASAPGAIVAARSALIRGAPNCGASAPGAEISGVNRFARTRRLDNEFLLLAA